jgi:uncharacterized membrane protein
VRNLIALLALTFVVTPAHATTYTSVAILMPNGSSFGQGLAQDGTVLGQNSNSRAQLRQPDGTLVELPTLGGTRGTAFNKNASGDIVGLSRTGATVASNRAFLYHPDGSIEALPVPTGASFGQGADINDAGTVVGTYVDAAGHQQAFRWTRAGGTVALASPDAQFETAGGAINASGAAVGYATDTAYALPSFAVRWAPDGTATRLSGLADATAFANAINDAGTAVGYAYLGDTWDAPYHGVVWNAANQLTDVGVLSGDSISGLYDINNHGVAIGFSAVVDANTQIVSSHLVRWTAGSGLEAIVLGAEFDGLLVQGFGDINDAGQILFIASDASGNYTRYLLTPDAVIVPPPTVPEPASWALLVAGFGLVGGALRRSRQLDILNQ